MNFFHKFAKSHSECGAILHIGLFWRERGNE
jgi:hypothetical protein